METLKIEKQKVNMIAHRGLSGLEAENTIEAFVAAANRSFYGIECSVRITKDNHFVVICDENTKRVSPSNLNISKSTYQELQEVQLYNYLYEEPKPYRKIPQLEDYLEICKKYEKKAVITIAPQLTEENLMVLVNIVEEYEYLQNSIFSSEELENLKKLRKINKDLILQYIVSEYDNSILNICRKHHLDISINYDNLSVEIVRLFHQYNIKINVFTVNNPIVALMLVTWNVDYITTDILE